MKKTNPGYQSKKEKLRDTHENFQLPTYKKKKKPH